VKRVAILGLLLALHIAGSIPVRAQSPGVAEWARESREQSKKSAREQNQRLKKASKKQQKAIKKNAKAQQKAAHKTNRGGR